MKLTTKHKLLFVALCLVAGAQTIFAQVGNEEVIVVKEYEATVQDAQKINIAPDIPEVEETKTEFTYSVPSKDYKEISFEANPLKPLSLSKEKIEKHNTSFIKLGFGSQLMPIAQLAYNDNKIKNLKFGIFYNHISAREFKIKNQRFSDDEAGAYLKFFPKAFETVTAFTFRNYRTHFYGTDSSFEAKNVREVYRTYDAEVYFKNTQSNKLDVDFKQSFRFNYLQETYGKANEWFVGGNTIILKNFLKYHAAGFNFFFDVSKIKNDSLTLLRTIFTPEIGYSFNNDDWKGKVFIGVAVDGKKAMPTANLHIEKHLYEHSLIAYASYQLNLKKNSLLTLSQTNNFIWNWVSMKNSTVGDLALGLKGTVQNFSYNVAFHFNHISNLPLFVNDTNDTKRFIVTYEKKAIVYNFHFEGGYNMKEWLRVSVLGDYNNYRLKTEARVWHEPAFKLTLRANYIWKNKIVASIDLYGITASYAKLSAGQQKKLNGTADINLSLEYLMNKHISFFAAVNNVANIKYQRWNNYQSYGTIGWIGAKFSF